MQGTPEHQGSARLWLISGTGEGPPLAAQLMARGWRLRVSVVSGAAARAYRTAPALELAVGAIGSSAGISPEDGVARELAAADRAGDPFRWVVDASHPFATRISAALARVCAQRNQPLLRLGREHCPPADGAVLLEDATGLAAVHRPGERLLLAIGARVLAPAVRHSPGAIHHARLLPDAGSLRIAMAAGLAPERVACLRPGGTGAVEAALCRRWGIETVLCRQSGGPTERLWQELCRRQGMELRLLRRPPEPAGVRVLPPEQLLDRLGSAPGGIQPS